MAVYKQTVLGPLWFFVQPFPASLVFMIVFGQIARLPTTNLPALVFYMSGIIAWSFFSNCLSQVASTFLGSGGLFRKIYFPRLIVPLPLLPLKPGDYIVSCAIWDGDHPVAFLRAIPELTVLDEKNSERSAYHGVLNLPAKLFVK